MGPVSPPALRQGCGAPFSLLVALTACGTLCMHMIIPALPETARALDITPATAQLTITLYLVGLSIGQLAYGPLSDRFALLTLTMSMAPAIAPAIGGYVTALASWRASFGLLAALGVTVLAWSFLMLPETLAPEGAEHSGSLLYSYALLLRSRVFCGYAAGGACSTTSC